MSDAVDQSNTAAVEATAPVAAVEPVATVEPVASVEAVEAVKYEYSESLLSRLFHAVYEDARGISAQIEKLLAEAKSHLGL